MSEPRTASGRLLLGYGKSWAVVNEMDMAIGPVNTPGLLRAILTIEQEAAALDVERLERVPTLVMIVDDSGALESMSEIAAIIAREYEKLRTPGGRGMSDIERTLALALAKNDITHLERELERAIEDAQKAHDRMAAVRAELGRARLRHDHIADGGDLDFRPE